MILVAGGDSFVYGSELKDQTNGPSSSTYAALLAKSISAEYICTAWPGNANNAITRMTMSACQKNKNNDIFVIVTWTFTQRFEFRFNYNTKQSISPWYSINSWTIKDDSTVLNYFWKKDRKIEQCQLEHLKNARLTGVADFAKEFYLHVGDSEYYELYSSLKEIVFLQNYLKLNQIPYMFLPADVCFLNHENYLRSRDQYLADLYEQIEWDKWFFFPKGTRANETSGHRGFYQWAAESGYSIGTTHPLEQAHYDAQLLMQEKFNELVVKNYQSC